MKSSSGKMAKSGKFHNIFQSCLVKKNDFHFAIDDLSLRFQLTLDVYGPIEIS